MIDMPSHVAALIAEYALPTHSVWIVQVASSTFCNNTLYVFASEDHADEFMEIYGVLYRNKTGAVKTELSLCRCGFV